MVNSFDYPLKTDKTVYRTSLQAFRQVAEMFICFQIITEDECTLNNVKLLRASNPSSKKKSCWQCTLLVKEYKLYKTTVAIVVADSNNNPISYQIHCLWKFLAIRGGTDWQEQRYTVPNWQPKSGHYNVMLKLYRSIFGKCRYTSLKLAVLRAVFQANLTANNHTANPVGLAGVSEIKKCYRLWHCQTYS
ncbi:MAG TPA: hypothetical protein VK203_04200 [Nostocaceae cyanobacterium]|nr:hypothetical protein [Nostocaceae cyanobacterium]